MKTSDHIFNFLINDIGLSETSIELGIKISKQNNISLPVALWSYGLLTTDELDKFYDFLWN